MPSSTVGTACASQYATLVVRSQYGHSRGATPSGVYPIGRVRYHGTILSLVATLLVAQAPPAADPEVEALLARAAEAREKKELSRALTLMQEACELAPAPELRNNVAFILQELGRYREAYAVYEEVLQDPSTDPELRALDRARMAELTPKLDRAWVEIAPELAPSLLVDGALPKRRGEEVPLEPRVHVLEHRADRGLVLRWRRFPPGERTLLDETAFDDPRDATLLFDAPILSLRVDGYSVVGLREASLFLPPGPRDLAVHLEGRGEVRLSARLDAGESLSIQEAFAPVVRAPVEPPLEETAPSPLPPILFGTGAAAAAAGTGLLVAAELDRGTVRDAERNGDGLIAGITYPEAVRLNDRADDRALAGTVALSAGLAVAVAGVVWWLLD